MLDVLGPGHVADVDEAVDAFFNFDERTEIGQLSDASFDYASDAVTFYTAAGSSRACDRRYRCGFACAAPPFLSARTSREVG